MGERRTETGKGKPKNGGRKMGIGVGRMKKENQIIFWNGSIHRRC